MKSFSIISVLLLSILPIHSLAQNTGYPINPVPFTAVKVTPGTFWGQRLEASRTTTVPLAFSKCEETGRYMNFIHATEHMKDPSKTFPVSGFSFDDTDPYKTIEGASYLLQTFPDKKLAHYVDSIIDINRLTDISIRQERRIRISHITGPATRDGSKKRTSVMSCIT